MRPLVRGPLARRRDAGGATGAVALPRHSIRARTLKCGAASRDGCASSQLALPSPAHTPTPSEKFSLHSPRQAGREGACKYTEKFPSRANKPVHPRKETLERDLHQPVCNLRRLVASGRLPHHPRQLTEAPGSSPPAAESWQVTERGQDFAVYQHRLLAPQDDGTVAWRILGRFTLLKNGLHYRDAESGEWKESRDLIESFPDGVIARYGPLRAIFSHDLNAENVFDVETPLGTRLRGGPMMTRVPERSFIPGWRWTSNPATWQFPGTIVDTILRTGECTFTRLSTGMDSPA